MKKPGSARGQIVRLTAARDCDDGQSDTSDLAAELIRHVENGYVRARFGGIPVLITPELAAEIRASRRQP